MWCEESKISGAKRSYNSAVKPSLQGHDQGRSSRLKIFFCSEHEIHILKGLGGKGKKDWDAKCKKKTFVSISPFKGLSLLNNLTGMEG